MISSCYQFSFACPDAVVVVPTYAEFTAIRLSDKQPFPCLADITPIRRVKNKKFVVFVKTN
jgi:hypothetical protein